MENRMSKVPLNLEFDIMEIVVIDAVCKYCEIKDSESILEKFKNKIYLVEDFTDTELAIIYDILKMTKEHLEISTLYLEREISIRKNSQNDTLSIK